MDTKKRETQTETVAERKREPNRSEEGGGDDRKCDFANASSFSNISINRSQTPRGQIFPENSPLRPGKSPRIH